VKAREILQTKLPRPFGEIHCLKSPDYYEWQIELSQSRNRSFKKSVLFLLGVFLLLSLGVVWLSLQDQNLPKNFQITCVIGLFFIICTVFFLLKFFETRSYNESILKAKEFLVDISFDSQKTLAWELYRFNEFLLQFAKIFQAQKLGLSSYSEEDFEHYHVLLLHSRNLLQEAAEYWVFYADTRNAEALSRIEDLLKQLKPYPKQDQDRR